MSRRGRVVPATAQFMRVAARSRARERAPGAQEWQSDSGAWSAIGAAVAAQTRSSAAL